MLLWRTFPKSRIKLGDTYNYRIVKVCIWLEKDRRMVKVYFAKSPILKFGNEEIKFHKNVLLIKYEPLQLWGGFYCKHRREHRAHFLKSKSIVCAIMNLKNNDWDLITNITPQNASRLTKQCWLLWEGFALQIYKCCTGIMGPSLLLPGPKKTI